MMTEIRLLAVILVVAGGALAPAAPASARGGGPANIMNSEGYQRALREERKLYQSPQPAVAPAAMSRHPHHRYHR